MSNIRGIIAVSIALLGCAPVAAAAEPPATAEQQQMPDILKQVMKMDGKWQAKASLTMEGKTSSFLYTINFRKVAAGQGLYMEESAEIPGVGKLQGANVIGFDPNEGKLHWFSVDNLGTTHDHIGELVGKEHLRLVHESQREGKKFREVTDFVWLAPEKIQVKLQATVGDEVVEVLEGTFARAKR
jgi:hypothetical protein